MEPGAGRFAVRQALICCSTDRKRDAGAYLFDAGLSNGVFKRDPQEQFRTYGEISYRMLLPICFTTILALVLGVMPEISPNFYAMASQAADSICQGWTGGGW